MYWCCLAHWVPPNAVAQTRICGFASLGKPTKEKNMIQIEKIQEMIKQGKNVNFHVADHGNKLVLADSDIISVWKIDLYYDGEKDSECLGTYFWDEVDVFSEVHSADGFSFYEQNEMLELVPYDVIEFHYNNFLLESDDAALDDFELFPLGNDVPYESMNEMLLDVDTCRSDKKRYI
jgi:hypothetical protein